MINEYAITFTLLTIYTIFLHLWSDLRELKVDSRRNYMMIGAVLVIGLISHQIETLIITGILTIILTLILNYFEKKQGKVVFGDGDKEILNWSVPGIALSFGHYYSSLFIALLMISFFSLALLKKTNNITLNKLPGLIFIALSYLVVLVFGWFL
ncbi:MAG TPA: hypothetical protein PKN54_02310 [Candidatus Cloacimonas acidaminovorans]|nr:hypothetical protein [Candidatus Cloacimonas acidaminovorans]